MEWEHKRIQELTSGAHHLPYAQYKEAFKRKKDCDEGGERVVWDGVVVVGREVWHRIMPASLLLCLVCFGSSFRSFINARLSSNRLPRPLCTTILLFSFTLILIFRSKVT